MKRICRFCQEEFETERWNKLCCTVKCANLWRYRNPANSIPAVKYRGANYRNFLMSLRTKLSHRRDLDIDVLCKLYEDQKGLCALSGRPLTFITGKGFVSTNISIDRIDSNIGYIESNIRLVCRHANTMKLTFSDEDLYKWCQDILDKRKKK